MTNNESFPLALSANWVKQLFLAWCLSPTIKFLTSSENRNRELNQYLELYIIIPVQQQLETTLAVLVAMLTEAQPHNVEPSEPEMASRKMQPCLTQFWIKLHNSVLCTPSTPLQTCSFSSSLPPPSCPPLLSYPAKPLLHPPPPPCLPLALPPAFPPFLQDGQGRSQNTIWNSETPHIFRRITTTVILQKIFEA